MELMKLTETMINNESLGNAYRNHGEDVLLIVRIEVQRSWSFVRIIKALTKTNDNKKTRALIEFMTRKQPTEMGLNSRYIWNFHSEKMTMASKSANIDHGLPVFVECVRPIIFMLVQWKEQPPDIATWKSYQECTIEGYHPKLFQITRKEISPPRTPFTPKKLHDQVTCEVYQDLLAKYPPKVTHVEHGLMCILEYMKHGVGKLKLLTKVIIEEHSIFYR
ncbi:unnamed protein product [Cochlearia groenlandica]